MLEFMKKTKNIILGLGILLCFYYLSILLTSFLHIKLPPAILGLVLFAIFLVKGWIKEEWIKDISNFLINNMAMFIVPFIGGLVIHKNILINNWLVILLVIFLTTTFTIVFTGLFVEHGLKALRLYKMRKSND